MVCFLQLPCLNHPNATSHSHLSLEECKGQEEVGDEDGDEGDDDSAGGGLSHTLGAATGGDAPGAADL